MYDTLCWKAHQEPKVADLVDILYNNILYQTVIELGGAELARYAIWKTVDSAPNYITVMLMATVGESFASGERHFCLVLSDQGSLTLGSH